MTGRKDWIVFFRIESKVQIAFNALTVVDMPVNQNTGKYWKVQSMF
jgi:hypothetical protein